MRCARYARHTAELAGETRPWNPSQAARNPLGVKGNAGAICPLWSLRPRDFTSILNQRNGLLKPRLQVGIVQRSA